MKIKSLLHEYAKNKNVVAIYKNQTYRYKDLYFEVSILKNIISLYGKENILLYLPNSIEYYISFFTIIDIEGTVVPVHISNTAKSIKKMSEYTNSRLIITDSLHENIIKNIGIDYLLIDRKELITFNNADPVKNPCTSDEVVLVETTGTTGKPKLVILTEYAVFSNIKAYKKLINNIGMAERALITSYLGSSHGTVCQMLFYFYYQVPVVIYDGLISTKKILGYIEKYEISRVHFVSSLLMLFCKTELNIIRKFNLEKLNIIEFGSSYFPPGMLDILKERFPKAIFIQVYGLSEAGPLVTGVSKNDWEFKWGSIGKPLEGVEIFIDDKEQIGQGELWIKSNSLMSGYYGEKGINRKEWFRTGDIVRIDEDQYIYYIGRIDRVFKSNGYRVNPEEIEKYLLQMEEIQDAYVYGKSDDIRGNIIVANIVARYNHQLDINRIAKYCAQGLPLYKRPLEINIIDKIIRGK